MSFQSKVYLPDIKECLGVKEISTNNIKKIFERIKKSKSTEVAKLKIDKSKLIFVPFIYLDFEIDSNYEYEAADEREEPYTDYVEKSRDVPYTDSVQKSRQVPYTDYERRLRADGGDDITPVTKYRTEYYTAQVTRYRKEYYTEPVTMYRTIEFNHRRIKGSKTKIYEGDGTDRAKGISTTFKNDKSDKSYLLNNFIFNTDATRKFVHFECDSQFSKNEIENWIYNYTGCNKEKIETEIIQFDINSAINKIKDEDIRDELLAEIEDEDAQGDVNRNYQVSFSKSLKKAKIVYLPIFVQRCKTSDDILFYVAVNIGLAKSDDKNRGTKVFPDSKTTEYLLKKSKKARGYNFYRYQYTLPLYVFLICAILNILLRSIFTEISLDTMIGQSLLSNDSFFAEITKPQHSISPILIINIIGIFSLVLNWLLLADKERTRYLNQNKEIFNLKKNLLLKSNVESLFSGCDLKTTGFETINNISPRKIKIIKKSFSINNLIIYFSSSVLFFDLIFSFFTTITFLSILMIWIFLTGYLFLRNWDNLGKLFSKKVSWTTTRTNLFFQYFAKSKKTINNFFIIFSIISSLFLGNEIRKSYPFYKADKKVPESKKSNPLYKADKKVPESKISNSKIIKIEPKSMDDENNKLKRINLSEGKVQKNLSINSFSEKFKRKDRKYLKPSIDGSEEINFYFNRALDNERLGRYKEAIADYDLIAEIKISERDYHYENALFYRAWLKIKNRKNHKGAIEDMEKLIIMNPYNIDLKIDLATFYSINNKNRKAVQILDKAIEENPNEGNLYYWKGIYKNEYSYPSGCRYINKSKKLKASDWYPGPWGNC